MNEKARQMWRHVFTCKQCGQTYHFIAEDKSDAVRDATLVSMGCEVNGDGVRCDKCVESPQ